MAPSDPSRLVASGSIVFQIDLEYVHSGAMIFDTQISAPWDQRLRCKRSYHGDISLEMTLVGEPCFSITCPSPSDARSSIQIVTFAWDSRAKTSRLSVEDGLSLTGPTMPLASAPPPLLAALLAGLTAQPCRKPLDFIALSSAQEPVGPMPGLHPMTRIDTPNGARPAIELDKGDVVLTDLGPQTVLARVERIVPPLGIFAPTRLLAPHMGLRRDMLLAGNQKVAYHNSSVEYELGLDHVAIPAAFLESLREDHPEHTPVRYCQFLLPKPAEISAQGTFVQSLNIGRMRRDHAAMARSVLAGVETGLLPDHGDVRANVVPDYAVHLLMSEKLA